MNQHPNDTDGRRGPIAWMARNSIAANLLMAILLGGVGGMAPSRRGDLARLGLRSILAGTLATMMTGCVAGILL